MNTKTWKIKSCEKNCKRFVHFEHLIETECVGRNWKRTFPLFSIHFYISKIIRKYIYGKRVLPDINFTHVKVLSWFILYIVEIPLMLFLPFMYSDGMQKRGKLFASHKNIAKSLLFLFHFIFQHFLKCNKVSIFSWYKIYCFTAQEQFQST